VGRGLRRSVPESLGQSISRSQARQERLSRTSGLVIPELNLSSFPFDRGSARMVCMADSHSTLPLDIIALVNAKLSQRL
jgi:hypothetical protein